MSDQKCPINGCLFTASHDGPCSWFIEQADIDHRKRWEAARAATGEIIDALTSADIGSLMRDPKYHTEQARHICEDLVPEWREMFIAKNLKYRKVDNSLGPNGIFPDVYRKVGILKDRLWDGGLTIGEPTDEVIMDLIGHLFLMLHMRRMEASDG